VIALRRFVSLVVLTSLLTVAFPLALGVTSAAESHREASAEHGEAEHHAPGVGDLLFPAINFVIYLGVIIRFVIPAMRDYLRRRRADIVQSGAESSALLATAEKDLAACQARLARLPTEASGIREDLVAIATRQGERLKAQAEETGTRRQIGRASCRERV